MITQCEPYLVNEKYNSKMFTVIDGFYKNSLRFEPLNEMADLHDYMILLRMLRSFSNTDFINIGAVTSQSVMKDGIKTRNPPVLIMVYPLANMIESYVSAKLNV